jgi:hypothetical protein
MPALALSLPDLVSPYQLLGTTLGDWQAAPGAIYVDHYEATGAAEGTTIRGVVRFAVPPRADGGQAGRAGRDGSRERDGGMGRAGAAAYRVRRRAQSAG